VKVPFFLQPLKTPVLAQVTNVEGLMVLLMKQRNGLAWTRDDKVQLVGHLKRLAAVLPALAVFSLPGGTLLLPVLAWFLDRRKKKKPRPGAAEATGGQPDAADAAAAQEAPGPAELQAPPS